MESKPFWASRTIVANLVMAMAAIVGTFGVDVGVEFQGEIVALVMAAANIVLRFITKQPVSV